MRTLNSCLAFSAAMLLASCGGGGGGSASTEPLGMATVTFEPLPINVNFVAGTLTADSDANVINVKASVSGAPTARFAYLEADAPVASSVSVPLTQSSAGVFTGVIKFRTDLAANTYSGAFKLRLCVDQNCEQAYSSNLASIAYKITADAGVSIFSLNTAGERILVGNNVFPASGQQVTYGSNTPVVWSVADTGYGKATVISQSSTQWTGRFDVPRAMGEAPSGSFNLVATPIAAGVAGKTLQVIIFAPY
jgi:hypothetical protein